MCSHVQRNPRVEVAANQPAVAPTPEHAAAKTSQQSKPHSAKASAKTGAGRSGHAQMPEHSEVRSEASLEAAELAVQAENTQLDHEAPIASTMADSLHAQMPGSPQHAEPAESTLPCPATPMTDQTDTEKSQTQKATAASQAAVPDSNQLQIEGAAQPQNNQSQIEEAAVASPYSAISAELSQLPDPAAPFTHPAVPAEPSKAEEAAFHPPPAEQSEADEAVVTLPPAEQSHVKEAAFTSPPAEQSQVDEAVVTPPSAEQSQFEEAAAPQGEISVAEPSDLEEPAVDQDHQPNASSFGQHSSDTCSQQATSSRYLSNLAGIFAYCVLPVLHSSDCTFVSCAEGL